MIVEEITNIIDANKMLCDFELEKGKNFTPIYEDESFYMDCIFGFDKFNQEPMYFRVLDGNPYTNKAKKCVRINIRKCKYKVFQKDFEFTLNSYMKDRLIKILNSTQEFELFEDSNHSVWECIIESIFCGVTMNRSMCKLKHKLLNKIPDYTQLPE